MWASQEMFPRVNYIVVAKRGTITAQGAGWQRSCIREALPSPRASSSYQDPIDGTQQTASL
jgi:hypothetical protein